MKSNPRRAVAIWLALGALLAAQITWAGALDASKALAGGTWHQPLSEGNQNAYLSQAFIPSTPN